ncbi:hypothetical protein PV08_06861 [Exophiala spinifera]|uniref:Glycosyl hydrolase family 13 catalytic domain-containing protein n=1 Tax=Exophiala spinifera TaxID=91928 RepID=A0A0D2B5Y7_9EURO|nr:uncharacterized protein PV08_06861 [Exophiala spinifera]KIW14080.1 hypothetical protein PV08_06861 [Exophiala spinifera]
MPSPKSLADSDVQSILASAPPKHTFHPSPGEWDDQVLYFLLPDRFSNNAEKGYKDNSGAIVSDGSTFKYEGGDYEDAIQTGADAATWRSAGTVFNGGTLRGLMTKLGYLSRLGVTALWIGPIWKQVAKLETYHGYGVQNFLDVDPRFGTREELKDLVTAAHKQGIYVILDIILNHSGNVFEYVADNPHYTGDTFDVKGFYDRNRIPNIPLGRIDPGQYPDAFPDAAVWPTELQDKANFTRKGQINDDGWDRSPEYLDGDFYDLKDIALGVSNPDNFSATDALKALCQCYRYWIAYADIDGYRIDTVKHMGDGPTRYFASVIHEFAQYLGKDRFLLMGEITGSRAFETVEATGLDAALGIGNVQEKLWRVPKGQANPNEYFDLFRNALYLNKGSHTWFRDKVVTMIDDHDQVWRGGYKGRFCSEGNGTDLVVAAVALNLFTLGIPCIYYGTEQGFDGQGGSDEYIREAMFGGKFGAFRSKDHHFFDEASTTWADVAKLAQVRKQEITVRRGRQYLREISGDGVHFGYPSIVGAAPMQSIIAWSRLFASEEVLIAINTDASAQLSVWVTVDHEVHPERATMSLVVKTGAEQIPTSLAVQSVNGRSVVQVTVAPGGVVVYK